MLNPENSPEIWSQWPTATGRSLLFNCQIMSDLLLAIRGCAACNHW